MYRSTIVLLVALAGVASAQQRYSDPQNAAILSDARYLSGDGTFGAAYTQEDGVQFKEETDADGNRRGAYTYIDPTGVRRTVSYTAGKNGFQASGDHLPVGPTAAPPVAPQPLYTPRPEFQGPSYSQPRYQAPPQQQQPAYRPQQQYQSQPSYQSQPQYTPQPQYNPAPQPQPQPQYQPQPQQQQYQPQPAYNALTTPPPHRFFPPGKLDLNRTPDGFSYTFSKS